jgi:hypothetical protein
MSVYVGKDCIDLSFLDLDSSWSLVVSFMFRLLYPWEKGSQ